MSAYEGSKIKELIEGTERVGTLGSPSSTRTLNVEILETAVSKKLVGEMILFNFTQDGMQHFGLGQINQVVLSNKWLEESTMRALARKRGTVSQVSGTQDTHQADVMVSAVFGLGPHGFEPSVLGTVPPTGTFMHLVNDDILDLLLDRYKNEIFYLGRIYGSETKLPMWFKHFGSGKAGAGEAYHIGIFGRTGSGKSVLAKMITLAYARHKEMGIFILDPQGEFATGIKNANSADTMANIFTKPVLRKLGRNVEIFNLDNILLSDWGLFVQFLRQFNFFRDLSIKADDNQNIATDYLEDFLRDNNDIKFDTISDNDSLLRVLDYLRSIADKIYSGKSFADKVRDTIDEVKKKLENGESHRVIRTWSQVTKFFRPDSNKKSPWRIIDDYVLTNMEKPVVVIDLSNKPAELEEGSWDDYIKPLIISQFFRVLVTEAERNYKNGQSLNTLVVIDEAHRLAPSGTLENKISASIRHTLVDAVRTTRKYGLGWMFISQTLSSLDREIVEQLRINFFGFGLSMGSELRQLQEIVGGSKGSMELYESFRDPQSSFDMESKQYSFMTVGPVSPLSFSGTPLFFNAFNQPRDFLRANGLESY